MSDTSQGPGWWLASDGRWYPPESHPNAVPPPPPPAPPSAPRPTKPLGFQPLGTSTAQWTQVALWAVAAAQVLQGFFAYRYWQAFTDWYDRRTGTFEQATSAQSTYSNVSTLAWLVWVVALILLAVWSGHVHTTTTSLLPGNRVRTYSRAWAIWVWFIPVVNVFSTPQVIAENQRIADSHRRNNQVIESWRSTPIQTELYWWWALVAIGMVTSGVGGRIMAEDVTTSREYLGGLTAVMIGSGITALGLAIGAVFITDLNEKLKA